MNSSVHIDNKNKDILILCKGPTQGLDNTILTAEAEYSTNFTEERKKYLFKSTLQRLFIITSTVIHYNSYLFVNEVKIYNSKKKILK